MNINQRIYEHAKSTDSFIKNLLASKRAAHSPSFTKEELNGLTPKEQAETFAEAVEQQHEAEAPKNEEARTQLQRILENNKRRAEQDELAQDAEETQVAEAESKGIQESFSLNITLNEKQLIAKDYAFQGKSFCLIGPAGTGKTTAQRAVAKALLQAGKLGDSNFRSYDAAGNYQTQRAPSIAFCAYTRRAASNLRKAIHKDPELAESLKHNIMTIHGLLEYAPETYFDPIEKKDKFRFAPRRHAKNPLNITHLIIEEASMLGLDLWEKLYDAILPGVQIIFIGDINQLPPVFGPSILNYALLQLPIVELTQVYRNQGIVLENAHRILKGQMIQETKDYEIVRGKSDTQVGQVKMAMVLSNMFRQMSETMGDDGLPTYDVNNDIILSPFNKKGGQDTGEKEDYHLGTDSVNKWIAQFVGEKRNAVVHEVIAGFNRHYLAIGDKVMMNKRDGIIVDIVRNPDYFGKEPQLAGTDLSRFGHRIIGKNSAFDFDADHSGMDYSNFSLEKIENQEVERKQQASHIVRIDFGDNYQEDFSNAGDFGPQVFSLGYALTVHKSQGSEWRKVFIIFHKDHSIMLFRELFYTAATRARTKVCVIAKDFIIKKAIENQRIKGNTLKDKLAYFNSGINDTIEVYCTKEN